MRIVFDIETNGLRYTPWEWTVKKRENPPPIADTVHCICLHWLDHGVTKVYHNDPKIPADGDIVHALNIMGRAHTLIGHNIKRFDLPVLKEQWGFTPPAHTVIRDTLVMSNMGYTSLLDKDKRIRPRGMPDHEWGKHTLRAWGYRIGMLKGHVNDTEDWSTLDQSMIDYCKRDVEVNAKLYSIFENSWAKHIPDAVQIEHEFVDALQDMTDHGWHINEEEAWALLRHLEEEKAELEETLLNLFPPREVLSSHIPNPEPRPDRKVDEEGWRAWERWVPRPPESFDTVGDKYWSPKRKKTKDDTIPFNPGSEQQVIWNLHRKYKWEPKVFTDKGNPKFGEEVIASLDFPETKRLVYYSQVCSRIAELTGDSGYLTLLWEDGRIHGSIQHCGAVTHRCTHSRPNMGNVTGVTNRSGVPQPFGKEMRALFTVPSDEYRIVGADASGLELRMLGNRMAAYDKGEFAHEVVNGDQHTKNAAIMGMAEWYPDKGQQRKASKPVIYAHNYGAANLKLGRAVEPSGASWSDDEAAKVGATVRKRLMVGLPALKQLVDSLKKGWKPGATVTGLDGRTAEVRAAYRAINTQLQMDGAIVVKWATVYVRREAIRRWGPPGPSGKWCMVGHVHDEYQFQVRREYAEEFGSIATQAFTWAGEQLGVCCKLEGEYKVGMSWADTH